MKILVAGIDSDIGGQIALQHRANGDEVVTTSRNGKGDHKLELSHPYTWPSFQPGIFDKVYYTIGIGEARASRMEIMQVNCFATHDFLTLNAKTIKEGGQAVVLTSGWGSISRLDGTQSPWYRMSKAALNMAVGILAQRHLHCKWTLMQPGWVHTKLNRSKGPGLTPEQSAAGIIATAASVIDHFCFMDYKGERIDF